MGLPVKLNPLHDLTALSDNHDTVGRGRFGVSYCFFLITNSRDDHADKHNGSECLELLHCMAADVYESSVSIANPPIPTDIDCEYMKTNRLDMSKYLEIILGQNNYRKLTDIQMLGEYYSLLGNEIICVFCTLFFTLGSYVNDTQILRCMPSSGSDGQKLIDLKFLSDRLSGPLTLYYVMEKVPSHRFVLTMLMIVILPLIHHSVRSYWRMPSI